MAERKTKADLEKDIIKLRKALRYYVSSTKEVTPFSTGEEPDWTDTVDDGHRAREALGIQPPKPPKIEMTWVTSSDLSIPISKLGTNHLHNIISLLRRTSKDRGIYLKDLHKHIPQWKHLLREYRKRTAKYTGEL